MSTKAEAIKDNIGTLLMYYYNVLVEDGCQDPKQEMATVLPSLIGLSNAQSIYVQDKVKENNIDGTLNNLIVIMKLIVTDVRNGNKINIKDLTTIQEALEYLKELLGGND